MTRSLNVTLKITEQHLTVLIGKSKAEVNNNRRMHALLKLTADGYEASRGLCATAELLAGVKVEIKRRWNYKIPWPLTRFSGPPTFLVGPSIAVETLV